MSRNEVGKSRAIGLNSREDNSPGSPCCVDDDHGCTQISTKFMI